MTKYYQIEPHVDNAKQIKPVIDVCYSKYIATAVVTPELITPMLEALCQKGYKMKIGTSIGHEGFAEGIGKFMHIVGDVFEADYFEIHTMFSSGLRMIKDLVDATNVIKNAVDGDKETCWVIKNPTSETIDSLVDNASTFIKPDVVCIQSGNVERDSVFLREISSKLHVKTKLFVNSIEETERYGVDYYGINTKTTLQLTKP